MAWGSWYQIKQLAEDKVTPTQLAAAINPLATKTQLSNAVADKATTTALANVAATIPAPATNTPSSEAIMPNTGAMNTRFAKEDHQHQRLSSATVATLGANGQQQIIFTRTFTNEPSVVLTAVENTTTQAPSLKVVKFLKQTSIDPAPKAYGDWTSGAPYAGCVIMGTRPIENLPVVGVLTGLLTALSGLPLYNPAANLKFSILVIQTTS